MRRVMRDGIAAHLRHDTAIVVDDVAARDDAGDVEGAVGDMTAQAARAPNRNGCVCRLVQRVKHDPLLRIVGGKLDDGGAGHVADGYRLVEEERSEEHTSELQSLRHLVCSLPL